eukprot:TRINITY_DN3268_c0_g1_i8.p3 TRINITY_DN3268_c0_g1~~TRINITY_DN3268_c0_g1_i8.p3  ORF type:complete len:229 (+),score=-10.08 TRINITY_DN3268_c0_g1_i8:1143-1829(+)
MQQTDFALPQKNCHNLYIKKFVKPLNKKLVVYNREHTSIKKFLRKSIRQPTLQQQITQLSQHKQSQYQGTYKAILSIVKQVLFYEHHVNLQYKTFHNTISSIRKFYDTQFLKQITQKQWYTQYTHNRSISETIFTKVSICYGNKNFFQLQKQELEKSPLLQVSNAKKWYTLSTQTNLSKHFNLQQQQNFFHSKIILKNFEKQWQTNQQTITQFLQYRCRKKKACRYWY